MTEGNKKLNSAVLLLWLRRLACYLAGLFVMACGVVFSVKSALGVSPVTCLANVTYQIFGVSRGIGMMSLGACTTLTYCLYILIELIILRRDFKPAMLLQIVASTIFGAMVTASSDVLAFVPEPGSYVMRLAYLALSIPLVAFGVMLYLAPNILPTPGEGLSLAISRRTGKNVAQCKMLADCCLVVLSAAVSLVYFRRLVGVREGTVISALSVGIVLRIFMRAMNGAVLRFVGRETKLERAVAASGADIVAAVGKKAIITISREYGSDGYEIGKRLAERLGISFYDRQLEPLEAQESGLPEKFIREHEQQMSGGFFYDVLSASYSMYNDALAPLDRLFIAQTRVLRGIAARDESCVIMGRCSDHILYRDPNSFRIFIHAPTDVRIENIARRLGVSRERAAQDVHLTDQGRSRYYRRYAGREWGDMKYYNLALDSSVYGVEGSVELICDAVGLWRSERAAAEDSK